MRLGERIKYLRRKRGCTQGELEAETARLGHRVKQENISRLEKSIDTRTRYEALDVIARALGVNLAELMAEDARAAAEEAIASIERLLELPPTQKLPAFDEASRSWLKARRSLQRLLSPPDSAGQGPGNEPPTEPPHSRPRRS